MVMKYSSNVYLGSSNISVHIIINGSLVTEGGLEKPETRINEDRLLALKEFGQNEAKIEHPTCESMLCMKPS